MTFTASQSGTYYVRASGDRDETGSYTLRVSDVTPGPVEDPPPVEPPAETVAPEEPGPARAAAEDLGDITELAAPRFPLGTLDGGADAVAWYRFTLSEAREVALGLRRQDADADLVLEDAEGNVLHSSERSGTANEWLRETLLAGTYYVRVEAQEAGANAYVFRYGVGDADPAEVTRLEAEQESVQEQVQQQPPAFGSQFYGFDLPEDTDGSADRISLGTVSAVDPEGGSVTYSIEGGNAARLFEIDAASGELFYTGGGEDYETGSTSFELTVRASDGDQTTDTTATVSVTDVAEAPAFGQAGYGFDLAENADGSTNRISLGSVSATDPDGGSVTYSIEDGNAARLFEIDAASGALFFTGGGEDYETGSTRFELTVRASDGDHTTDTTVAVTVTDVDDPVEVDPPVAQPDQSTPQTVSEPAGEDFSAGTSTSGRVAVGDTATGNIGSNDDRDWFAVELVAGRTYVIDLRGSAWGDGTLSDPYLRGIHDSDGNLIPRTTNDDGGYGLNSRVTFTATESGTHYIAAGAYSRAYFSRGTYEVEVTETSRTIEDDLPTTVEDDFPGTVDTTGTVEVGGSATGELQYESDRDWFAVELEAGKTYQIDIGGAISGGGTLWQGHLHGVYDADGYRLRSVYDAISVGGIVGGTNPGEHWEDAQVFFTPDEDGTYYVVVGDRSGATGTYTVRVTEIEDDFPATVHTTGTVEVGGSATGEAQYEADHDWFAVELSAGETYKVQLMGSGYGGGNGTLQSTQIHGIHDANGRLISNTTDAGSGPYFIRQVLFTPDQDGTYYVAAGSVLRGIRDEEVGTYTLVVSVDDFRGDTGTTGTVGVGDSVTGEIEAQGDEDWFAVTLEAGKTYQIDMEGSPTDGGTLENPFLHTMRRRRWQLSAAG